MPCEIVLNPWKRTPNQLIKYNFSFNKINSIIYHVLQQNFLLFAGKKNTLISTREGQRLFMQLECLLIV